MVKSVFFSFISKVLFNLPIFTIHLLILVFILYVFKDLVINKIV